MTDQQDAVALVTGAASGIGRAIASTLAEEWTVYATDVATDGLADVANCETARLDVTDGSTIERVLDRVRTTHRGVDCLVNNAGYAELGPVEDVPFDVERPASRSPQVGTPVLHVGRAFSDKMLAWTCETVTGRITTGEDGVDESQAIRSHTRNLRSLGTLYPRPTALLEDGGLAPAFS